MLHSSIHCLSLVVTSMVFVYIAHGLPPVPDMAQSPHRKCDDVAIIPIIGNAANGLDTSYVDATQQ